MASQLNNRHSHHGKPKILIVDDESDILDLLYRTFYREFRVVKAESGQAALARLVQHADTAVIIADQRMPRMNGTELLRQVAQNYPNIIRIILTGYTDVDNLVDAINTGQVFKYITKPWAAKELRDIIQQAVDTHAVLKFRTQELDRILAQETLLKTITQAIHSSLDPKQIFSAITQKLGQALQTDGCAISLWTPDDDYVDCVGLYDARQADVRLPKSQVKISENPILQELVASRSPVIFDDLTQSDTRTPLHLPFHSLSTALLLVPLITDGQIIGSISLRQSQQPRHWHREEINLAQAVAHQAAIAVQQARLYQTTRQQAEQLLALDQQKTALFQNISHEFRTPLTLTIGPLESAVEQGVGLSLEESAIALRNSQRLLRLVNQLLDLQRLDAGSMQATFYPCDFAQVVSGVAAAFQAYCDRKHITLSTQIYPCPSVYLDLEKFDKVIYNILANAVKFTPTGGTIQITLNTFEQRCYLEIEDTGIGIRREQIPHIFERFQQADGSASRTHEGTGLGLALVKELVELHGGDVRVSSTYGTGTLFTVELPLGAGHLPADRISQTTRTLEQRRAAVELADLHNQVTIAPAPEAEQALYFTTPTIDAPSGPLPLTAAQPDGATILIVDDNPDLRSYVAKVLQRQGHRISTAQNGADGLEVARNTQPQLIITDLMMPQGSGIELIQQIRLDPSLQGTPIILLTANVDDETRLDGVEQGADAYISKPFKARELLAEVRNLLALKANEHKVAELNRYLTESVLKRFLPAPLVKKAARGELQLNLKPEPRLVTVLFSDIVGFTQLSNTLRSRRVAELLNEYFAVMTQVIFQNGGTVDKFMGDAILALFGAPDFLSPNEQVRRAIATARHMYQALDELNQRWQGVPCVKFRCGIHQGTAVVGMFGSPERADYTAIGPSVNIAARLQEAADSESILVSAAVADYLDEQEIIKFSPLQLKGLDETVLAFNIKTTLPAGVMSA